MQANMAKTNGLKIISDPWIFPEEKANFNTAKNGNESPPSSPIFKAKKNDPKRVKEMVNEIYLLLELDSKLLNVRFGLFDSRSLLS